MASQARQNDLFKNLNNSMKVAQRPSCDVSVDDMSDPEETNSKRKSELKDEQNQPARTKSMTET